MVKAFLLCVLVLAAERTIFDLCPICQVSQPIANGAKTVLECMVSTVAIANQTMRYLSSIFRRRWLLSCLLVCVMWFSWATPAQGENFDRQSLRQQSFAGQDLRGNNYTSTDMAESDLSNTNLRGVRLFDTNLTKANLENADMTGATLDGTRFIRANLKNAILEGAYAFSTDFRKATIEGADFTDVDLDVKTNDMLCALATGVNPVTGRATKDTLYCP